MVSVGYRERYISPFGSEVLKAKLNVASKYTKSAPGGVKPQNNEDSYTPSEENKTPKKKTNVGDVLGKTILAAAGVFALIKGKKFFSKNLKNAAKAEGVASSEAKGFISGLKDKAKNIFKGVKNNAANTEGAAATGGNSGISGLKDRVKSVYENIKKKAGSAAEAAGQTGADDQFVSQNIVNGNSKSAKQVQQKLIEGPTVKSANLLEDKGVTDVSAKVDTAVKGIEDKTGSIQSSIEKAAGKPETANKLSENTAETIDEAVQQIENKPVRQIENKTGVVQPAAGESVGEIKPDVVDTVENQGDKHKSFYEKIRDYFESKKPGIIKSSEESAEAGNKPGITDVAKKSFKSFFGKDK